MLSKLKTYLATRIQSEPVLTYGFLMALVNCLMAFGLPITAEQLASLDVFLLAAISFHVRRKVTPVEGN